jgi:beta-lactamase superfamily II metal-dependent hydrolase
MLGLEMFRAGEGDALLIHYGTPTSKRYALIDGATSSAWNAHVRPGLAALAVSQGDTGGLPIAWASVSHVDADHVAGMLQLFREVANFDKVPVAYPDALFINSPVAVMLSRPASSAAIASGEDAVAQVAASYGQGAEVVRRANESAVEVNPPGGAILLGGDTIEPSLTAPVKVRVIAPTRARVDKLLAEWRAKLGPTGGIVPAAADVDESVSNLSSLVLLVSATVAKKNRTILLCGDALDTNVIEGLTASKIPVGSDGTWTFDVVKLPHHGSSNNNHRDWFERVHARHYAISGNGRHENPDESVLKDLVDTNRTRTATIWLSTPFGSGGTYGSVMDKRYETLARAIKAKKAKGLTVRPERSSTSPSHSVYIDASL